MLKRIFKVIIFMAVLGMGANLYAQVAGEDAQIIKEREQLEALLKEVKEIVKIADELKEENANLKTDLTKLKDFNTVLQKRAGELYTKNQNLEEAKQDAKNLGSVAENLNNERRVLKKMNEQLKQDMVLLEDNMRKEKAALYEELGTAYVQSKLYDLAIDTYEKSVKLEPNKAEVYYNLGLLYKHSQSDGKKAISNFKKYLQLNPKAKNKKEVEYFIAMLQSLPGREVK